jgi:molybdopterin converting factor subunit 1
MITLNVKYFAILREQRGLHEESLETPALTPEALYCELAGRHQFTARQEILRVAVNDAFAPWQAALRDGDRIAFIPPVAGG